MERRQAADSATTLPCGVDALDGHHADQSLRLVLAGHGTTEVMRYRSNRVPEFYRRGARPNVEVHIRQALRSFISWVSAPIRAACSACAALASSPSKIASGNQDRQRQRFTPR